MYNLNLPQGRCWLIVRYNRLIRLLIPLVVVLIAVQPLKAQQKINHFDVFDETNGLVKAVVSGTQDHQGFLWFGTEGNNGVFKYDGVEFRQYKHDQEDTNSIVSGNIYSIITDNKGQLWFASDSGGLSKLNPGTGQFSNYTHSPQNDNSLADNTIYSLLEDQQGNIWIATAKSLDKYSPEDETFTHFKPNPANPEMLSSSLVYHLYESRDGMIWIGTYGGGLNMFNPDTESFTVFINDPDDPWSLSHNTCGAIIEDSQGYIWVGGKGGLNRLDRESGRFKRYQHDPENSQSIAENYIWDIYEDKSGFLWLGGFGGGLGKFDKNSETVQRYKSDSANPGSLSSDLIFFILEDRGGVLWIGTVDGGLNKHTLLNEQFSHYGHIPGDSNSFAAASLFTIYQTSDEIIWTGSQGHQSGLCGWDRENGIITHFKPDENNPDGIPEGEVLSLFEDSEGDFWIGQFGGLSLFDRENKIFSRFFPNQEYLKVFSDKMVRKIAEDSKKNLWLATEGGLVQISPNRKDYKIFFENTPLSTIFIDHSGDIWIGTTSSGIKHLTVKAGEWEEFRHDPQGYGSLGSGEITDIFQDKRDRIWIGTGGGGLNLWNYRDKTFTRFTQKDGFISSSIFSILEDPEGNLWMGTSGGLVQFNYDTGMVRNFTVSDGLQGNEFSIRNDSAITGKDGLFYFVGKNGLTLFNPLQIKQNQIPPEVVLTSFRIFNEEIEMDLAPYALENLELSWKDSMLSFEFAALDFTNPEQNQYSYKLEGFNNNWIPAENNRMATYTNLDGGDYTFHVKASNNHGVWNEEGIVLSLHITSPWWETALFYSLIVLVIIIFIISVIYYVRKLLKEITSRKQAEQLIRKSLEEKNILLKEVHHRVKNNMAIISSLLSLQSDYIDDSSVIEMLNESKSRIQAMALVHEKLYMSEDFTHIDIKNYIEALAISVQTTFTYNTGIKNIINVECIDLNIDMLIPCGLIINEILTNSYKYAFNDQDSPEINISMLKVGNEFIHLSVEDNGSGFPKGFNISESEGLGMKLIDSLITQINGKYEVTSIQGVSYSITFPAAIAMARHLPTHD